MHAVPRGRTLLSFLRPPGVRSSRVSLLAPLGFDPDARARASTPRDFDRRALERRPPRARDDPTLARAEVYLLSVLYDLNFTRWPPSVVAAAIVGVVLEDEGLDRRGVIDGLRNAGAEVRAEDARACMRDVDALRRVRSENVLFCFSPIPRFRRLIASPPFD